MQHQNNAKPNQYHRPLPEWARGLLLAQEVTGSKPVGEECQNQLHSYCFAHFLIKIQKILDFLFLLFLSSNIAPWIRAEWTNMCLNLVMQKIKIMNHFCLPEYSILIGHYETTGLRSIFTLLSLMWTIHLLWCWSNSFVWHVYWFLNILIRKRLIFVPIQINIGV